MDARSEAFELLQSCYLPNNETRRDSNGRQFIVWHASHFDFQKAWDMVTKLIVEAKNKPVT